MTIEFFCPNEHQLSAPDTMAGKAGKCPKCGSKFLIPTLEELSEGLEEPEPAPAPVASGSSKGSAKAGKSDVATGSEKRSAWQGTPPSPSPSASSKKTVTPAPAGGSEKGQAAAPLPAGYFVFLCPNNHKLNGPLSLKGKAGQCPHCGAKFRIPEDDEVGDESPSVDAMAATEISSGAGSSKSAARVSDGAPTEELEEGIVVDAEPVTEEIPSVEPISVWQLPPPPPGRGHRMAELFSWFWSQREQRSVVELVLKDGQAFVPKWFAPELSLEGFGTFAVQDEFGRYTITVLPWDSIAKMSVRNLEDIPPQFG